MADPNENDPPRNRSWDRDRRDRDDDDRPRRRRDDDDDFDDRPRRRRDEPKSSSGLPIVLVVLGVCVLCCVVLGGAGLLLFPAVERVRSAAARMKDSNNMKQLALAMHNYNDSNGRPPPAQENLSWRVHLLPYMEQSNVYRQFDLNQPWDAPANRRLASQKIPTLVSASDPPETVETRYRVFVGPGTLYEPGKPPLKFAEVRDGLANTIFAVEASELVPWPQPKELEYDRNGPLPALGVPGRKPQGFLVAMLDGSVRFITPDVSPEMIRGGIEPNDGRFLKP
jgi:hypothetical protein